MKSGPKRTENWGLTPCPAQHSCAVCAALGDRPEELQRVRDTYLFGVPTWLVARFFGIPNGALRSHAFHKNWHRRRSYNLPDPKYLLTLAALARARDSWHLISPTSADKMLKLLAQLAKDGDKI